MEIIYQKNKDKQPVYDMYQKIFEDPEPFAQYYFEEIYATNQVNTGRRRQQDLRNAPFKSISHKSRKEDIYIKLYCSSCGVEGI